MATNHKEKKRLKRDQKIHSAKALRQRHKGITSRERKRGWLGLGICAGIVIIATVVVALNI